MDIANQNYKNFTAEERFKLTLSAAARNDEKEMQLLWDTCPIKQYSITDMQYRERMYLIAILGDTFFKMCVCLYSDIEKADGYIHDQIKEREYELAHRFEGLPSISENTLELVKTIKDTSIARLKALYLAFNDFCLAIEIDSEHILNELPIKRACNYIDRWLKSDISADEGYREWAKEMFLENWRFNKKSF